MGLSYNTYLTSERIFGCAKCKAHLAVQEDIMSRVGHVPPPKSPIFLLTHITPQNFRGQHGKAYLFSKVVNVINGEANERNMTTGRHIVRDISCRQCRETVGWKYDKAFENGEKYKEGKFILEAQLLASVC